MLRLFRLRTHRNASTTAPNASSTIGTAIAVCVPDDMPLEFWRIVEELTGALSPEAVAPGEYVLLCAAPPTDVDVDADEAVFEPLAAPELAAAEVMSDEVPRSILEMLPEVAVDGTTVPEDGCGGLAVEVISVVGAVTGPGGPNEAPADMALMYCDSKDDAAKLEDMVGDGSSIVLPRL